jgi:hypothetical protein
VSALKDIPAPSAHDDALLALVEITEGTLFQLRNGLKVAQVDVVAGTQLIRDNADLLSRSLSQLAPKIEELPAEDRDEEDGIVLLDIDRISAAVELLDRVAENDFCPVCNNLK